MLFTGTDDHCVLIKEAVLYFAVLAVFSLTACAGGGKEDQAGAASSVSESSSTARGDQNEAEGQTVNVWGDSMAQGVYGDGVSYPAVLEELTQMKVNNFGITGESSAEIMARSLAYGDQSDDIMIIQMGDNGGWNDIDDLIRQHKRMIREGGTDRYIIVSSTDDPNDFVQIWGYTLEPVGLEDTWYEAKLREEFGEHLFIGRKYLIEHGLEVNGLTETAEDKERAKNGYISLQLRNPELDNTHLSAAGYTAMAYGIYEKGKELGYWTDQ